MLAIDRQAEQIRKRDELIRQLYWLIIALGLTVIVLAVMIWGMTQAAASSVCLTKKEARELWPKQHIYWYSKNHCWSNRRGPPQGIKTDPVINHSLAQAKRLPDPVYDALPKPRPKGDRLKSDPPDDCCWPPLDELLGGDKETPLRQLSDKLNGK